MDDSISGQALSTSMQEVGSLAAAEGLDAQFGWVDPHTKLAAWHPWSWFLVSFFLSRGTTGEEEEEEEVSPSSTTTPTDAFADVALLNTLARLLSEPAPAIRLALSHVGRMDDSSWEEQLQKSGRSRSPSLDPDDSELSLSVGALPSSEWSQFLHKSLNRIPFKGASRALDWQRQAGTALPTFEASSTPQSLLYDTHFQGGPTGLERIKLLSLQEDDLLHILMNGSPAEWRCRGAEFIGRVVPDRLAALLATTGHIPFYLEVVEPSFADRPEYDEEDREDPQEEGHRGGATCEKHVDPGEIAQEGVKPGLRRYFKGSLEKFDRMGRREKFSAETFNPFAIAFAMGAAGNEVAALALLRLYCRSTQFLSHYRPTPCRIFGSAASNFYWTGCTPLSPQQSAHRQLAHRLDIVRQLFSSETQSLNRECTTSAAIFVGSLPTTKDGKRDALPAAKSLLTQVIMDTNTPLASERLPDILDVILQGLLSQQPRGGAALGFCITERNAVETVLGEALSHLDDSWSINRDPSSMSKRRRGVFRWYARHWKRSLLSHKNAQMKTQGLGYGASVVLPLSPFGFHANLKKTTTSSSPSSSSYHSYCLDLLAHRHRHNIDIQNDPKNHFAAGICGGARGRMSRKTEVSEDLWGNGSLGHQLMQLMVLDAAERAHTIANPPSGEKEQTQGQPTSLFVSFLNHVVPPGWNDEQQGGDGLSSSGIGGGGASLYLKAEGFWFLLLSTLCSRLVPASRFMVGRACEEEYQQLQKEGEEREISRNKKLPSWLDENYSAYRNVNFTEGFLVNDFPLVEEFSSSGSRGDGSPLQLQRTLAMIFDSAPARACWDGGGEQWVRQVMWPYALARLSRRIVIALLDLLTSDAAVFAAQSSEKTQQENNNSTTELPPSPPAPPGIRWTPMEHFLTAADPRTGLAPLHVAARYGNTEAISAIEDSLWSEAYDRRKRLKEEAEAAAEEKLQEEERKNVLDDEAAPQKTTLAAATAAAAPPTQRSGTPTSNPIMDAENADPLLISATAIARDILTIDPCAYGPGLTAQQIAKKNSCLRAAEALSKLGTVNRYY